MLRGKAKQQILSPGIILDSRYTVSLLWEAEREGLRARSNPYEQHLMKELAEEEYARNARRLLLLHDFAYLQAVDIDPAGRLLDEGLINSKAIYENTTVEERHLMPSKELVENALREIDLVHAALKGRGMPIAKEDLVEHINGWDWGSELSDEQGTNADALLDAYRKLTLLPGYDHWHSCEICRVALDAYSELMLLKRVQETLKVPAATCHLSERLDPSSSPEAQVLALYFDQCLWAPVVETLPQVIAHRRRKEIVRWRRKMSELISGVAHGRLDSGDVERTIREANDAVSCLGNSHKLDLYLIILGLGIGAAGIAAGIALPSVSMPVSMAGLTVQFIGAAPYAYQSVIKHRHGWAMLNMVD